MSDRFFSSSPVTTDRVTLDGPEAHHLIHVMRTAAGQTVAVFDGSGAEFDAIVEKVGRATVELRVLARHEIDRELPFVLVAGVALPKGDRQKWLVEKLTELGVTKLVPLSISRGVAQPTAGALDRLGRAVIEASKQCGRNRLMQIAEPQDWHDWIQSPALAADARRFIAHPDGRPIAEGNLQAPAETQLAIGSEGGFTEAEVDAALANQWQLVGLGPRILRVETAAVALVAATVLGIGK